MKRKSRSQLNDDDEFSLLLRKINAIMTINEEIGARILSVSGPVVMRNKYNLAIERCHNGVKLTAIQNDPYILDSAQILRDWKKGNHHLSNSVMDVFNDNLKDMIEKTQNFHQILALNSKLMSVAPKWVMLKPNADVHAGLQTFLSIVEGIQCCFGELELKLQSVSEDRAEIDEQARLINESLQKLSAVADKDGSEFIFTAPLMYDWADSNIFRSMSLKQLSAIESMLDRTIFSTFSKTYQPTPKLIYQASRDNFTTLIPKVTEFFGLNRNPFFSGHMLFIFQSVEDGGGGTIGFVAPFSTIGFCGTLLGIDIPTPTSTPYQMSFSNLTMGHSAVCLKSLLGYFLVTDNEPISSTDVHKILNRYNKFESFRYVSWTLHALNNITKAPSETHSNANTSSSGSRVRPLFVETRSIDVTDAAVYVFSQE